MQAVHKLLRMSPTKCNTRLTTVCTTTLKNAEIEHNTMSSAFNPHMFKALPADRARDQLEELATFNVKKARAFVRDLVIHEVNVDEGYDTDSPGTLAQMLKAHMCPMTNLDLWMHHCCVCVLCTAWNEANVSGHACCRQ